MADGRAVEWCCDRRNKDTGARSSPLASSTAATATDALWGSTPMSTFMRAHLRFDRTSAIDAREGHSDFVPFTYLFLVTPHAAGTGGTQAENKPARLAGDRKFASDPYNRYPRSIAAADHQAPDQS